MATSGELLRKLQGRVNSKSLSCVVSAFGFAVTLAACGGGGEPFSYPSAQLESNFGAAGVAEIQNPRDLGTAITSFDATSLALDQNGRVVVAGLRWQNERQAWVTRLDAQGQLDPSCGTGGWQIWSTGGPAIVRGVMSLRDGRIAVLGRLPRSGMVVLKPDCSLDTSFGSNGFVQFDEVLSTVPEPEPSVAVQDASTGRIAMAVAGKVMMLDERGQRVSGFGQNGVVTLREANGNGLDPGGFVFLPDGRFLVSGITDFGLVDGAYVGFMRLMSDGSLDTSFGVNGDARWRIGSNKIAYPWGFARAPSGQLHLTGQTQPDFGSSGLSMTNAFWLTADSNGSLIAPSPQIWDAGPVPNTSSNFNRAMAVDAKGRMVSCAYWLNNTRSDLGPFATEESNLQFRDATTGQTIKSIGSDGTLKIPAGCLTLATDQRAIYTLGNGGVTINAASFLVTKVMLPN